MKNKSRRHRISLTLLFTGIVFCFLFLTVLIVGVTIYILVDEGVFRQDSLVLPLTWIVIFLCVAGLIIGGTCTFFLSQIPLKPVNALIDRMNRLAAGDYKSRMQLGKFWARHATIAELSASINRMAEELESTEMLRSDFINHFSHEFKTPIVSIAGFAKLLRRGNLTEAQKEEYLQIIEEESLRLSQMATNVLNLTKVENTAILADLTEFNLSEQIRSAILLLHTKWERKNLDFILNLDEYSIVANEELLKQVWINLLDNAVKFSPEYGTIEVTVRKEEERLSVLIRNTGSEIEPEKQDKIFHKFYQADESHATEGNGVGLAVVKQVVGLHKGTISVKSGQGATAFVVELPGLQE